MTRTPPRSTLFPYTTLFRSSPRLVTLREESEKTVEECLESVDSLHEAFNRIELAKVRNERMQRSEEHTSELQSRPHLVCRLLLEKKKINSIAADRRVLLVQT